MYHVGMTMLLCSSPTRLAPQRWWCRARTDLGCSNPHIFTKYPCVINMSQKYPRIYCINKYLNAWKLRLFVITVIFLLNTLDYIIEFLVKIYLIWCDQFNCNFKYDLYYFNRCRQSKLTRECSLWGRDARQVAPTCEARQLSYRTWTGHPWSRPYLPCYHP